MSAMSESIQSTDKSVVVSKKRMRIGPQKSGVGGNHGASEMWTHFAKQHKEGQTKRLDDVTCNYCHIIIHAPSTIGTNKLWNHLEKCKPYLETAGEKTQTLLSFSGGQASSWKFDQERCRIALRNLIIQCELPFSFVEKEAFKSFCGEMQPKFHVLSRTTVTKDCIQFYSEEKEKLINYFKVFSPRVSITTDMWTSIQNLGYMVLTAHFIDKDWTLQKKIINFRVLPHPHTGEAIAKAIEECLLEWNLTKVMTITLDNAKNNDTCILDLKRRLLNRSALLVDGDCLQVRCFAHVINLVVRDGVYEMQESIKKLRHSVKYVKSGPSRMQNFKKCVADEKITNTKSVCLDVKTRWNSTYLMIDSALGYEKAFDKLVDEDPNYKKECEKRESVLERSDWRKLKSLHTFLREFYDLTKRISGSLYVTSNTYFDEVTTVKDLILEHLKGDEIIFQDIASKMNEKFEKYCDFDILNLILIVAIVLDPRYKLQYVEYWYSGYLANKDFPEDEISSTLTRFVEKLKVLMYKLYECYKLENTNVEHETSTKIDGATGSTQDKPMRSKKKDDFRGFLKKKDHAEAPNDLDRYLADGVEDDEEGFNILHWWHGKNATYRALAIMARDVLAIPITSVASECAFSTAGRVLDPFRSSLTPSIVEALICTQDWIKNSSLLLSDEEKLEVLEEIEKELYAGKGATAMSMT